LTLTFVHNENAILERRIAFQRRREELQHEHAIASKPAI
jgi:hypothetical protein